MSGDNENLELEKGESGKKAEQLYRFEYVTKRRKYEIREIAGKHYIAPVNDSVFVKSKDIIMYEKDLAEANRAFLEIGWVLRADRISDIYQGIDYMAKKAEIKEAVESFVNTYGTLDILRGLLIFVFSLDLPIQRAEIISQINVLRPDDHLGRKYGFDKSHTDILSDPTFYRKMTKEIKSHIAERNTIKADMYEAIHGKYATGDEEKPEDPLPVMNVGQVMPMFFPEFNILDYITKGEVFEDFYSSHYCEPLDLFLLCAKLYKLFWDGMGYFLKEYDKNKSDIINIVPFATSIDFEMSPFLRKDKVRRGENGPTTPPKTYIMGFNHLFLNLFEAMQVTCLKQLIHKDADAVIPCKTCGKPFSPKERHEFTVKKTLALAETPQDKQKISENTDKKGRSDILHCSDECKDNFTPSENIIFSGKKTGLDFDKPVEYLHINKGTEKQESEDII